MVQYYKPSFFLFRVMAGIHGQQKQTTKQQREGSNWGQRDSRQNLFCLFGINYFTPFDVLLSVFVRRVYRPLRIHTTFPKLFFKSKELHTPAARKGTARSFRPWRIQVAKISKMYFSRAKKHILCTAQYFSIFNRDRMLTRPLQDYLTNIRTWITSWRYHSTSHEFWKIWGRT